MDKSVNEKFQDVRLALGLRRNKFALKVGVSPSYISLIERGIREPEERVINMLCSNVGVSRRWWDTGEGEVFSDKDGTLRGALSDTEVKLITIYRGLGEKDKKVLIGLANILAQKGEG